MVQFNFFYFLRSTDLRIDHFSYCKRKKWEKTVEHVFEHAKHSGYVGGSNFDFSAVRLSFESFLIAPKCPLSILFDIL